MSHDPLTGEADRFPGAPHPRERVSLIGHDHAEQAFLAVWRSGRLPHAWLIGGPEGIGKATFAYRAARFLLAGDRGTDAASLAVPPEHPAFRRVAALSHADLVVIRRQPAVDKKGPGTEIKVNDVRDAIARFSTTAGEGGWRVGIIDAADDLNASGANALLKLVEEPPPRCVFFIISHLPGRVLPTIRSRCRKLILNPLSPAQIAALAPDLGAPWSRIDGATIAAAAAMAEGSVRQALRLMAPETMALVETISGLLHALPALDMKAVLGLAETLSGRDGEEEFDVALDVVRGFVSAQIDRRAGEGAARLAPLVEVWEKIARSVREADAYNLDRRPLVISMFGALSEAVGRSLRAA